MNKKLYLTVMLFPFALTLLAQTGSLTANVKDSVSGSSLTFATATVFNAKDTSVITYRLSNNKGDIRIPDLPLNTELRILITYAGYSVYRRNFTLHANGNEDLRLGVIMMRPTAERLEDVTVIAERPPVIYRKDTVEFNAAAFKTLPSALLEDLLKKLPGVRIDKSGNILYEGLKVNRLLVDGKAFFGDNAQMATQNLPANIIDKVQLMNDYEELAINNNNDSVNIGKVINITLKKGVKKGMFGKAYAGGGSDNRREAGGIANIFRDTLQLSLLGFTNNINKAGLNMKDINNLGGFNRSGYQSMMSSSTNSRAGLTLNGISFGGTEDGLVNSNLLGVNINHAPTKKFSLFTQGLYGNFGSDVEKTTDRQIFSLDTITSNRSLDTTNKTGNSYNISVGSTWKPDDGTNLSITAGITSQKNTDHTLSGIKTFDNKSGVLNNGNTDVLLNSSNNGYRHSLVFTKRFTGKLRKSLSVVHVFSANRDRQTNTTNAHNEVYLPVFSTYVNSQLNQQNNPVSSGTVNVSYTQQLNSKFDGRLGYEGLLSKTTSTNNTYLKRNAMGLYDSLANNLSGDYYRKQLRSNASASIIYKYKTLMLTTKVNWLCQDLRNVLNNTLVSQHFTRSDFLFNTTLNWKTLSLSLSQDVIMPSFTATNPVINTIDPFHIQQGNPNLLPEKQFGVYLTGRFNNRKTNTQVSFYTSMAFSREATIQSITLSDAGVQRLTFENAASSSKIAGNINYDQQIYHMRKFQLLLEGSLYASYFNRPVIYNHQYSMSSGVVLEPEAYLNLNWDNIVELNPGFTISFENVKYSQNIFPAIHAKNSSFTGEIIIRVPKRLVWESNISHRNNGITVMGLPATRTYWNAAVTAYLLKNSDKLFARLAVYDILDDNNNANRYTSYNMLVSVQSNVLTRYWLLTLTYNFRKTGGEKLGGSRKSLLQF